MIIKKSFASDNNAGVHPEILEAIATSNKGHVTGYGDDPYTESAIATFKHCFGDGTDVFFVYGGTGANVLSVGAMCRPFESLICAETAHINVDECGAPERFSGCKLLDIPTPDGKLTPELILPHLTGFEFEHHSQPKAISITQPTELGTLYTIEEITAIKQLAEKYGLYLHIDGARIANAAVALGKSFKSFTKECGVDIVSFGGNKNGLMFGEAVLIFNKSLSENFKYMRKQATQLHSKMRFISVQFDYYLKSGLWKRNAEHANKMSKRLEENLQGIAGLNFTQKVQTNAVFATIPKKTISKLQAEYFFYVWNEMNSEVRWMTAFDTEEEDIKRFVKALRSHLT